MGEYVCRVVCGNYLRGGSGHTLTTLLISDFCILDDDEDEVEDEVEDEGGCNEKLVKCLISNQVDAL